MIKSQYGFTLLELLVTVALLAVISSLAIVQYQSFKAKAYDIQSLAAIESIVLGLENMYQQSTAAQIGIGIWSGSCSQTNCHSSISGVPNFSSSDLTISVSSSGPWANAMRVSHSEGSGCYVYSSVLRGTTNQCYSFPLGSGVGASSTCGTSTFTTSCS